VAVEHALDLYELVSLGLMNLLVLAVEPVLLPELGWIRRTRSRHRGLLSPN
jgi:hypothetical protein